MILKIWLKLLIMVLLAILPLMVINYISQRDSLNIIFDMASRSSWASLLENYQNLLKKAADQFPEERAFLRDEFNRVQETKIIQNDLTTLRSEVMNDLGRQSIRNSVIVCIVFLAASFFVALSIVRFYMRLIKKNENAARKLENLHQLENWQRMARMIVHEIKGPLAPIKLLSGDMPAKYDGLQRLNFAQYLKQSCSLIQDQVVFLEKMIEGFTRFGKLPQVTKKSVDVGRFLKTFLDTFREADKGSLVLEELNLKDNNICLDPDLIARLLQNLIQNAREANPSGVDISISGWNKKGSLVIQVKNPGQLIPKNIEDKIFTPNFTTKDQAGKVNMGLGLAICKKIALDHGGELSLVKNDPENGVVFELEIPQGNKEQ